MVHLTGVWGHLRDVRHDGQNAANGQGVGGRGRNLKPASTTRVNLIDTSMDEWLTR
jgi:hypothetical protein